MEKVKAKLLLEALNGNEEKRIASIGSRQENHYWSYIVKFEDSTEIKIPMYESK